MTVVQRETSTLVAIRAAHHAEATPKYDRVVFEFTDALPLLNIEYVQKMIEDGSGAPVAIAGAAILAVRFSPARAHSDSGQSTAPGRIKTKMPVVKEIVSSGDFEAVVTYGIGVARKTQTRISTMESPHRLVIDFLL